MADADRGDPATRPAASVAGPACHGGVLWRPAERRTVSWRSARRCARSWSCCVAAWAIDTGAATARCARNVAVWGRDVGGRPRTSSRRRSPAGARAVTRSRGRGRTRQAAWYDTGPPQLGPRRSTRSATVEAVARHGGRDGRRRTPFAWVAAFVAGPHGHPGFRIRRDVRTSASQSLEGGAVRARRSRRSSPRDQSASSVAAPAWGSTPAPSPRRCWSARVGEHPDRRVQPKDAERHLLSDAERPASRPRDHHATGAGRSRSAGAAVASSATTCGRWIVISSVGRGTASSSPSTPKTPPPSTACDRRRTAGVATPASPSRAER